MLSSMAPGTLAGIDDGGRGGGMGIGEGERNVKCDMVLLSGVKKLVFCGGVGWTGDMM